MKKYMTALLIIFLSGFGSYAQTKSSGGVRRGGTSMDITDNMKERIKAALNISDAKTDSVVTIQQTFQYKIRSLKMDTNLNAETKRRKVAELEGERRQKLKEVINDQQINNIEGFVESRRSRKGVTEADPTAE
ncbi:MAG TPA: hypothetical protein VF540_08680 [Segetibacter sp.]